MDPVIYSTIDHVALIQLNRPDKYNAFNREMALMLQMYLDNAEEDENIRCICISGIGKAFSAGQDLGEVTGEKPASFNQILSEHYNPIIK
ncbi:MAG: enoyl-CoA hydratase-related protein, partial [Ferruginibacter sp.]